MTKQWTTYGHEIVGYFAVGVGTKIHLARINPDKSVYAGRTLCGRRGVLHQLDQRNEKRMCAYCLDAQAKALELLQKEIDNTPPPTKYQMSDDFARCDGLVHSSEGTKACQHRRACLRFLSPLPSDGVSNFIYISRQNETCVGYCAIDHEKIS